MKPARFMIHLQGAVYSNELYDARGREVFTLDDAVGAAEHNYGPIGWEVYNGEFAANRFADESLYGWKESAT